MSGLTLRAVFALAILGSGGAAGARAAEPPKQAPAAPMQLKGGESVTAFGSLTIEGEDRIHVEFARPALSLDMNPEDAPGLDWGVPRTSSSARHPIRVSRSWDSPPPRARRMSAGRGSTSSLSGRSPLSAPR